MTTYQELSIEQLRSTISLGGQIIWVGYLKENVVLIRLNVKGSTLYSSIDLSLLKVPKDAYIVKHCEATSEPLSFVGVTWQRSGWLKSLRIASIYGINLACKCEAGLGNEPTSLDVKCTMGYDIETSQHLSVSGGFPPPNSTITSIALWCTCGYSEGWTTISHKRIQHLTYSATSSRLVRLSLLAIRVHQPEWLVGYNCYQFDNCSMAYHCPKDLKYLFRGINSGAKSTSRHAFYIDLPGINNVDLYTYLDKCMRGNYAALGLDAVAKHHNLAGKTQMPTTLNEGTLYSLIQYNMNDSILTAKLWHATGVCKQVIGLCSASCAPPIDCIRYITGTMASCAVSSYCISNNMLMDWSECNLRIGYEGGTVLEPKKQLFRKVTVCDFSSMYPTIIMDIGISPENVTILATCSMLHEDKIVWWNNKCTIACIKGKIVKYQTHKKCMTRDVLKYVTTLRSQFKKSNTTYSTALKVLANSLYGALGFASSPLHSPRCAATVTVAGRTALALGYTVFTNLGLTVVYGDTDSCFLAAGSKTESHFHGRIDEHINASLNIFHKILQYTPMPNMRMEKEDEYESILLVDKKHYAYSDFNKVIKTKGLSQTRKDRFGICRDMTSLLAETILHSKDIYDVRDYMIRVLNECYIAVSNSQLDMYSVSREVRYEGNSCYRFTDVWGNEQNVPVTRADKTTIVNYDPIKILKTLEKDMNRLCIPAGLGTVANMLKDAEF